MRGRGWPIGQGCLLPQNSSILHFWDLEPDWLDSNSPRSGIWGKYLKTYLCPAASSKKGNDVPASLAGQGLNDEVPKG